MFNIDKDVRTYYAIRDSLSPEQRRNFWQTLDENNPGADLVTLFRSDSDERLEMLSWSVINRLPPSNREFIDAMGFESQTMRPIMDKFFKSQLDDMDKEEQATWRQFVEQMHSVLAFPATPAELDVAAEWQDAWDRRFSMNQYLVDGPMAKYGQDVAMLADQYFAEESQEVRRQIMEDNPDLELYLDEKNDIIMGDPLLAKYFTSMDTAERLAFDGRAEEIAARWPDNEEIMTEYRRLKLIDRDVANQYWADNPTLSEEMAFRSEWDLEFRGVLEGYADAYANLAVQFPFIRELPEGAEFGTQSQLVADMIAAQSLGRFELPENLDARELKAHISQEIDAIPDGQWRAVMRRLDEMGNLDRRVDAFLEFRTIETVDINQEELSVLLIAMEEVREEGGWTLDPDEQIEPVRGLSGSSSGQSARAVRNTRRRRNSGGRRGSSRGGAVATTQQVAQAQAGIGEFLGTLRGTNPLYWRILVQMSGMTDEQRAELLAAQGIAFAEWLAQATATFSLAAVYAYFNTPRTQRAPSRRSGNRTQTTLTSGGV